MTLALIAPPEDTPVSLAEAKLHLHEESNEQNTLIETYIAAATASAEAFTGRALCDQTWDFFTAFPTSGGIVIPRPPLIELIGVFYSSDGGPESELVPGTYVINRSGVDTKLMPGSSGLWPTATSVRIRFRAGYLDPVSTDLSKVPGDIKAAILLHVGHLFSNREDVVVGTNVMPMPNASETLLRRHRVLVAIA